MKVFKKVMIASLIVFGAVSLGANKAVVASTLTEKPIIRIVAESTDGNFRMYYEAVQESKVRIRLYDESGNILHSEVFQSTKSFVKRFNFKNLPVGNYYFSVSGPDFDLKETVAYEQVQTPKLQADVSEVVPGDKYRLSISGAEESNPKVYIYDEDGRQIFADTVRMDKENSRMFDLTQVYSPAVVFVVAHEGRSVRKTVNLK